ncbi:MAG: hypothetical protein QXK18_08080 [Candidatus Bathyarchaeia archaeon]
MRFNIIRACGLSFYEELAQSFPEDYVEPYGTCLIIPPQAFKSEWVEKLKAENCSVFQSALNNRMVFLVRKKNSNSQAQAEPQAPPSQPQPKPLKPFEWNEENIRLIQRLRAEGLSLRKISKRLAELGFKPPAHITISKKLKILEKPAKTEAEPKPQALNCEADDGLFRELMQSAQLLYSHGFRRVCSLVLKEASRLLMEG